MDEKQTKIVDRAVKSCNTLYTSIETLDFQLEKFNTFQKSLKTFKVANYVSLLIVSMICSSIITYQSISMYSSYYIESEIDKRSKIASILDKYSIVVSDSKESLQIYTRKTNKTSSFETDKYEVLEIKK